MNMRVMVLGLLECMPRHGYEIQKWLELSRTDRWADVLPGSIYHALRQMEKEGLVEVRTTEQNGHRSRAIYAITEMGQAKLKQLLQDGWLQAPRSFPANMYVLLTFSRFLQPDELERGLRNMISVLEEEMASWQQSWQGRIGTAPVIGAVFDNGREHIETDLRLLYRLLEDMEKRGGVGGAVETGLPRAE